MIRVINLTPHDINIVGDDGQVTESFPASGELARCDVEREQIGEINGIPVNRTVFGQVTGLPKQQEGVVYVVSALVAQAAGRDDVLIPDDTVRDEEGRIIGCRGFARV